MRFSYKILILLCCFLASVYGFLIKIPKPLRGHDKLLHGTFYFLAAVFLNFLFRKRQWIILPGLFLFGILIEYLQQAANRITHSHIHGRFDPEDIYANGKGLLVYLLFAAPFWIYQYFRKPRPI
ncbi:MAG TPA: hypothetical protein VG842_07035 [Sediminibacterium sp.]|nr:hypothetical protein [Sediminibacterium sp.]